MVKDGKIDRVQITRENESPVSANLDWKQSPANNIIHPETPIERYDENMRYLTDEEWLKKQGRKDPIGRWYNKETRESEMVYDINKFVDETVFTQETPLENEAYQYFDEKKKTWVVDEVKKEEAEQEKEIAQKKAEIAEAEQKRMRSVLAIFDNTANDDDLRINEEYRVKILDLRAEIQELGKKSA
jgi:hypothetical protein